MSRDTILHQPTIEQELHRLFSAARYEVFEDGMESGFSKDLINLINRYGESAFDMLNDLILSPIVNVEAAAEACRWIGRMANPESHISRRQLLERVVLEAHSARVRDGAALGLALLDDPDSIPVLRGAVERETVQELKHDLQQVLAQLLETQKEKAR